MQMTPEASWAGFVLDRIELSTPEMILIKTEARLKAPH